MARQLRVAAIQLAAHDRDSFTNVVDGVLHAVRCAAAESDLVVLPEGTFPAYVLGGEPLDGTAIDDALARLAKIAAVTQTVIVAGAAIREENALYNAGIVIDADGSLAGRADKLFLWHFDRRWFSAGERLAPVPTQLGPLGVLVCADGRLPTISQALVDAGAVALVMPTAWVTTGRDPDALENVQADLLARVRAYENAVPFVAANKCGSELGMVAYCGKSQIVDAAGNVLAMASEREPQTLRASVVFEKPRPRRAPPRLSPRQMTAAAPLRLAISYDPLPNDVERRLELLADAFALCPRDDVRLRLLDRIVPAASLDDEEFRNPGVPAAYRRAGYRLLCWEAGLPAPWTLQLARARALELRLYVVVFDRFARRAYAVDPDGAPIAGTFDEYRLASFAFDPQKTEATLVAPSTDVAQGLDAVASLVERKERAAR